MARIMLSFLQGLNCYSYVVQLDIGLDTWEWLEGYYLWLQYVTHMLYYGSFVLGCCLPTHLRLYIDKVADIENYDYIFRPTNDMPIAVTYPRTAKIIAGIISGTVIAVVILFLLYMNNDFKVYGTQIRMTINVWNT